MLKIGLTGGIGSGKSTAAQFFADLHIPVIDADLIAHQLSQPQQTGFNRIVEQFGQEILTLEGQLNRNKLRELVFSNADKKRQLEAILHPLIYAEIFAQVANLNVPYCIICIPLLVETQKTAWVDRVLVVDCPLEMQFERVKNRNGLNESQIYAIISRQASRKQRLRRADDIIDNSKSATHLAEQVKKLHNFYLLLSSA